MRNNDHRYMISNEMEIKQKITDSYAIQKYQSTNKPHHYYYHVKADANDHKYDTNLRLSTRPSLMHGAHLH